MIIDRLYERVEEVGGICVGLDTDISYIPDRYLKDGVEEGIFNFNKDIIEATRKHTAIYKLQIAYYEKQGIAGMKAYSRTLKYLKEQGILSIGDIKRGDIAATAEAYSDAHFAGDFEADFITLSPYMGFDTIEPYMEYLKTGEKGIFVLVRTSNPGAKDIEDLQSSGKTVYDHVAMNLEKIGEPLRGKYGYSNIGAVVGGTSKEHLETIRNNYKNTFFLVPGYGAQGGGEEVKTGFIQGNGAIVNSSRGIICNHMKHNSDDVKKYAKLAIEQMGRDING